MKILCFSDLHQNAPMNINGRLSPEALICVEIFNRIKPNVVVISGDIYESRVPANIVYKDLATVFPDIPVICCLGNHEFFWKKVYDVYQDYRTNYKPKKYNVHYVDVVDSHIIENVNFIGNVLWYDGSMSTVNDQNLKDFANHRWMDYTIKEFDFVKEYDKNVTRITESIKPDKINILVTHCVPHNKLNGHMSKIFSEINAYSGSYDLLENINVQYSISGHTHWPIKTVINETKCFNIGNDYFCDKTDFKYEVLEV